MFVLNEGVGTWDGTVVNPQNPQRRDVQVLQKQGYIVVQIDADNPGVWPFHCHIAWHVSAGLYVNVMVRSSFFFTFFLGFDRRVWMKGLMRGD